MILKRRVQTMLIGFAIWIFLLIGVGHNSAMAAMLTETGAISQAETQTLPQPLDLELGVDRYLMSMPPGYYTIATIPGLKNQLKNPKTVLVDVREPAEYQVGHIPHAVNIPLRTLAHTLDQVPRDRPVVLYCSSGYRSAMGVMTLHLLGYENAKGFPPSFAAWQAAGEAVALGSTD